METTGRPPAARRVTFEFADRAGEELLRELILYIAGQCECDPSFGAVKLNKILFCADFYSFALYGEPITGVAYLRLPQGPAPVRLKPLRLDMENRRELAIRREDYYGHIVHHPIPLRRPNLDAFKARDIALVDQIIRDLQGQTAEEGRDLSRVPAWEIVGNQELIPYEAIFLSAEPVTPEDRVLTAEVARAYGW